MQQQMQVSMGACMHDLLGLEEWYQQSRQGGRGHAKLQRLLSVPRAALSLGLPLLLVLPDMALKMEGDRHSDNRLWGTGQHDQETKIRFSP